MESVAHGAKQVKKLKKKSGLQIIKPTGGGQVATIPTPNPRRRQESREREQRGVAEAKSLALGYLRRFSASTDNVEKARLVALLDQLVRKYGEALGADILGQYRSAKAEMQSITPAQGPIWSERPPESGTPIVERPSVPTDGPDLSQFPPELRELMDRLGQIDGKLKLGGKGKKAAKQLWKNVRIYMGDVNRARGHASQKILEEGAQGAFGSSKQIGPDSAGAFGGSRMQSPDVGPSEFSPFSSMTDPYAGMPYDPLLDMPLDANGNPLMMPPGYGGSFGYGSSFSMGAPFPTNFAPDVDYTAFATGNYLVPGTPVAYSNIPTPSGDMLAPEFAMFPEAPIVGPPTPPMGSPFASFMDYAPPAPSQTSGTYTPEFDLFSFGVDYSNPSIDSSPDLSGDDVLEAKELVGEQLSQCARLIRALEAAQRELESSADNPDAAARAAGARYLLDVAKRHTNRALTDFEPMQDDGISGFPEIAGALLRSLGGGAMLIASIAVLYAGTLLADRVTGSVGNVAQGATNGLKLGLSIGIPLIGAAWLAKKFGWLRGRR